MKNEITLSITLPASPQEIYEAWMSTKGHTEMTGSPATVEAKVGGKFSAWENYIFGKTLELDPYEKIIQTWRTTEFPEDSADSHLEILLEAVKKGTKLTLVHTGLPEGSTETYRQGWEDFYFKPMKEYFG